MQEPIDHLAFPAELLQVLRTRQLFAKQPTLAVEPLTRFGQLLTENCAALLVAKSCSWAV